MEVSTAVVLIAAIAAAVTTYAIFSVKRGADRDSKVKHEEFKANLQPTHLERMASIAASRDAEIAKATKKEPSPMFDGTATRQIEGA